MCGLEERAWFLARIELGYRRLAWAIACMFGAVIKKEWEVSACVIVVLKMHILNSGNHGWISWNGGKLKFWFLIRIYFCMAWNWIIVEI